MRCAGIRNIALTLGLRLAKQATAFTPLVPSSHLSPTRIAQRNADRPTPTLSSLASIEPTTDGIASVKTDTVDKADFLNVSRHAYNEDVNKILEKVEGTIRDLYYDSIDIKNDIEDGIVTDDIKKEYEQVYANSYVDLGKVSVLCLIFIRLYCAVAFQKCSQSFVFRIFSFKVDTVGFDYDYTLVTYSTELLKLIYEMALKRLVEDFQYPEEMLQSEMKFDPKFSVRGLAVDRETGWICHLSYTHKVAVAYEGRQKVSRERLMEEYTGKSFLYDRAKCPMGLY